MAFSLKDLFPEQVPPPSDMGGRIAMPQAMPQAAPARQGPSKGQMILGILGDALAGARGGAPVFGQMMAQRRQGEQDEVKWQRNRQAEMADYGEKLRMQQQYKEPDVSPMERDAAAWTRMGPDMQAAYRASQAARPQFIPDGMGGGSWASPPGQGQASAQPIAPVGKLTPVMNGGSVPQAPSGFPYYR